MFQTAELGQKISKKEFKEQELILRANLLSLQQELRRQGKFSVLLDFAGVRGAGKGTSANLLNKWMDARWILTHAYDEPTDEESQRPRFWKFWRFTPPRGQIGIHMSGRYSRPLLDYVYGDISQVEFKQQLDRINNFEKALADDGTMVLKFWMHISKKVQKKRLEKLEDDPLRSWRMSDIDWKHYEMYDKFIEAAEQIISLTNTGHAPWEIVEGQDYHFRSLRVGELFQERLERHMVSEDFRQRYLAEMREKIEEKVEEQENECQNGIVTILDQMDLSKTISKKDYREQLAQAQARLAQLRGEAVQKKISTTLVFEGPDAAGKGGCIRRITEALDARYYKVYPFAAPTDIENAHHYLWRFWNCVPRAGRMTIFDRSWYGRVLVERVEGFAGDDEWRRAFAEINDFEDQFVAHGIVLLKFWLQISKDEQLARFKAREVTPYKRWKLQDEDWRNRDRWDEYVVAAHEMIQQTSVTGSPWILVENESKNYGRIKVLNAVCDALETALAK
ncbi:MAG: polyphosphate:AMP phosphotransferase [Xanthomonadales bacterium]|jgi:polyphosphate:AMP phosphotransferase|nr:polyphosphate:AMP phosphotransferase [Xanthomonadales bacterium]